MKDKIYKILPDFLQGLLISLYNYLAYKARYGGKYKTYYNLFDKNRSLTLKELKEIQKQRFHSFLEKTIKHSSYYTGYSLVDLEDITKLPIISKEDLRQNIEQVHTISKTEGIVSKTGGTTGKSLEVIFTKENMQERFAMLDEFRGRFGYKLGKKTAWFSGKDLLTQRDIVKNRFWKTDRIYNVRYYSTFHIKENYMKYYIENLIAYKPEYFVGFPSSIFEIAKFGLNNGYNYPQNTTKAIFPTAETITHEMREVIEKFFKTRMYNQYASSEGAPFIFECVNRKLHVDLQSGIFEVLDNDNKPSTSGRLILTSFTTEGTPLIRYDIGDTMVMEDASYTCSCGNNNPLVKEILGRIDDYIYSPENGKINLGNISNTLKDTNGIVRFQAVQNELNEVEVFVIKDDLLYNSTIEKKFIKNWRDRIGDKMDLKISYVDEIPVEHSGKYRLVKNNIKHLIQ